MMFEMVAKPPRLRDTVYEAIRDVLRSGSVPPGERFVEETIASELGVSRTPVREALFQLERDGLLQPRKRGFELPRLQPEDVRDILEMRLMLEPGIARRAAIDGGGEANLALNRALKQEEARVSARNVIPFAQANAQFRETLFDMCRNDRLVKTVRLYDDQIQQVRLMTLQDSDNRAFTVKRHKKLAAAITKGLPDRAEEAMREILEGAISHYAQVMGTDADWVAS